MALTCTNLLLNLITLLFLDVFVVSDLNKNLGGSMDLAQKRQGSADLHTPIHPPPYIWLVSVLLTDDSELARGYTYHSDHRSVICVSPIYLGDTLWIHTSQQS